jgi:hypothetical protein
MKLTIAILFSLFTLTAFADCNREAEFIGKARNVVVKEHSFSFQIKLGNFFHVNALCPLFEEEAQEAVIEVQGRPHISEGSEVSGVLVFDESTQTYRID